MIQFYIHFCFFRYPKLIEKAESLNISEKIPKNSSMLQKMLNRLMTSIRSIPDINTLFQVMFENSLENKREYFIFQEFVFYENFEVLISLFVPLVFGPPDPEEIKEKSRALKSNLIGILFFMEWLSLHSHSRTWMSSFLWLCWTVIVVVVLHIISRSHNHKSSVQWRQIIYKENQQ